MAGSPYDTGNDAICGSILVADDDAELLAEMKEALSIQGHTVITAVDGRDALSKIAQSTPDIVVLSSEMPNTNGIEVFAALRNDTQTRDIPVIVLYDQPQPVGTVLRGWSSAINCYITKPLDMSILLTFVSRILQSKLDDQYGQQRTYDL